MPKFQLLI